MSNDQDILKIDSPRDSVGGPYYVVYKDMDERWVIVAMDWNKYPTLALRWFWGTSGNPTARGYPTWLVLPSNLHNTILNGLPLPYKMRAVIDKYLKVEIPGDELINQMNQ